MNSLIVTNLKDLIYANQAKSDIFHQSSEFQKVMNILKAGFRQGDGFHQGIELHQCEEFHQYDEFHQNYELYQYDEFHLYDELHLYHEFHQCQGLC